jgi:hypothetical protein
MLGRPILAIFVVGSVECLNCFLGGNACGQNCEYPRDVHCSSISLDQVYRRKHMVADPFIPLLDANIVEYEQRTGSPYPVGIVGRTGQIV